MTTQTRASAPGSQVPLRDWIAVGGGVLGAFMAVLDIQITNASLPDIEGALGASVDEGSWISTAYLIAEIITIPLTGWLAGVFGLRRYLVVNASLFLGFSVLCGLSGSLDQMVLFRAGQGFTGGVLIPLAFTIILQKLPPAKRAIGMAMFGFSATFAPSIGPSIGGWLTDTYSWHWIFYINIIPGALLIAAVWIGLDNAPMQLRKLLQGDWVGIILMAVGLGSLEYVLEEGDRKDWFASPVIVDFAWIAVVALAAFVIWEFRRRAPLLDLRLLGRRSLGTATAMNFVTGLALYGSVYVLPLYLSQTQGYDAQQIGVTLMWSGLPQLALFPLTPVMMRYVDSRVLCGIGILLFAASCLLNGVSFSPDTAEAQLRVTQVIRALGQPLLMAPLSQMATAGLPPALAGGASALFNMMRNLGGSVGIAMLSTVIEHREHYHFSIMAERITQNSGLTAERLSRLGQAFVGRGADGQMRAVAELASMVRQQAEVMAYGDSFFMIGIALVIATFGTFFLTRAGGGGGGAAH
jgi:DHA2 family multidrug resistance protein